mmetsp:Transcript_960/g.3146  ORF Transcript_960/g.3146 Transcript_960/m.3146 type:complete len:489 (+) Transcript_960:404-1870(+)
MLSSTMWTTLRVSLSRCPRCPKPVTWTWETRTTALQPPPCARCTVSLHPCLLPGPGMRNKRKRRRGSARVADGRTRLPCRPGVAFASHVEQVHRRRHHPGHPPLPGPRLPPCCQESVPGLGVRLMGPARRPGRRLWKMWMGCRRPRLCCLAGRCRIPPRQLPGCREMRFHPQATRGGNTCTRGRRAPSLGRGPRQMRRRGAGLSPTWSRRSNPAFHRSTPRRCHRTHASWCPPPSPLQCLAALRTRRRRHGVSARPAAEATATVAPPPMALRQAAHGRGNECRRAPCPRPRPHSHRPAAAGAAASRPAPRPGASEPGPLQGRVRGGAVGRGPPTSTRHHQGRRGRARATDGSPSVAARACCPCPMLPAQHGPSLRACPCATPRAARVPGTSTTSTTPVSRPSRRRQPSLAHRQTGPLQLSARIPGGRRQARGHCHSRPVEAACGSPRTWSPTSPWVHPRGICSAARKRRSTKRSTMTFEALGTRTATT